MDHKQETALRLQGYVVCFVSVYTISYFLLCRVGILLFLSLIYTYHFSIAAS